MGIMEKVDQVVQKARHALDDTTEPGPVPTEPPGPGAPSPTPDPPLPEPDIKPSSTPDGPQTIPSPSTPLGEPGPDPQSNLESNRQPDRAVRGSSPHDADDRGLGGSMGVSSERMPHDANSIEGTGSHGTATELPNGTWPTMAGGGQGESPDEHQPPAESEPRPPHPQEPAEGPEMDDLQQAATQGWRDKQPPARQV